MSIDGWCGNPDRSPEDDFNAWQELIDAIVGTLSYATDHPAFIDYTRKELSAVARGRKWKNETPWDALGEKYLALATMITALDSDLEFGLLDRPQFHMVVDWMSGQDYAIPAGAQIAAVHQLAEAPVYFWHDETLQTAMDAPLPTHTIAHDLLPLPAMFMSFPTSWEQEVVLEDGTRLNGDTNWMLLKQTVYEDGAAGVLAIGDYVVDNHHIHLLPTGLKFGDEWPGEYGEDDLRALILRLCGFVNSEYVEKRETTALDRPRRRELKRKGIKDESKVSIVRLRRRHEPSEPAGPPGHTGRHISKSFWVTGHFRAQWYPSIKAHRVKWIEPYLKGAGLPTQERVYDVKR